MEISRDVSGVFSTFGVVMLYVEFAFPKFAQLNPIGRWFNFRGPESSRVARIFGALCCMVLALKSEGVFPGGSGKFVLPLIVVGAVTVMAHDLLLYWSKVPSQSDEEHAIPESKHSGKKRRKWRK